MRAIDVVLDFTCADCGYFVSATVRCSGKGLAAGPHTVAAVKIVCPACEGTNQVYFEPSGRLRAVEPLRGVREALEPSVN
jgi:hypothetical protein